MNKICFISKKDIWLGILVWGISVFPALLIVTLPVSEITVGKILPIVLYLAIISWFWFGTRYTFVDDHKLLIQCGPIRGTVNIKKIRRVESSRKPWSSAALSLDRLKITTTQGLWNAVWYISPKDKQGFILELKKRNSNIEISL